MLGLNHAYVTAIGRLIGVVALKEVSSKNYKLDYKNKEIISNFRKN